MTPQLLRCTTSHKYSRPTTKSINNANDTTPVLVLFKMSVVVESVALAKVLLLFIIAVVELSDMLVIVE